MAFTREQLQRYARQIVMPEIGRDGQQKLAEARVLVIGAGALGSAALMYLAAAGVGTIGVADFDVVTLSNLQRQIVHGTDRLGEKKTSSARRTLEGINPEVRVVEIPKRVTCENILSIIADYDMVLDGTDHFENKLLINDACVIAKKPFVHAGILRLSGQVMTWLPGKGCCLRCVTGGAPALGEEESCVQAGVLGAAVGVLSSLQALEAIKYITGTGKLLTGRMFHFDGMTSQVEITEMPEHSPYCRVCGDHPDITDPAEHPEEYELSCGL